jgi:Glycerophosphoryl diester phosphodiesterase family
MSPLARVLLTALLAAALTNVAAAQTRNAPAEDPADAQKRHARIEERRKTLGIICHRGASELAHENTLEAFRATFELGADGNEFDIRVTKDGVLVVFHDDMLDRLLDSYGDVSEFSWEELQRFQFRDPLPFRNHCRIPTLVEVFDLHRRYAGLMHLDIKVKGIDKAIADLLTKMDMWDQVAHCNNETGGVILTDSRYKPRRYKGGLYLDHGEVFPEAIAAVLKRDGDDVIVDDPRGVITAIGRKIGKVSTDPVSGFARGAVPPKSDIWPTKADIVEILRTAPSWDKVVDSAEDRANAGRQIRYRARAAEDALVHGYRSKEVLDALEERVRNRSLHKDWMVHGFDGAMALRSLIRLKAPNAIEMARFTLWRDDPALEPVVDPRFKNPRAWTDFRVKMVVFPALEHFPGADTEKLCRDYLALSDDQARKLGPDQFEAAGRALFAVSPRLETALELMKHRLQIVRGRAILDCLSRWRDPWAKQALEKGAPHALAYYPPR